MALSSSFTLTMSMGIRVDLRPRKPILTPMYSSRSASSIKRSSTFPILSPIIVDRVSLVLLLELPQPLLASHDALLLATLSPTASAYPPETPVNIRSCFRGWSLWLAKLTAGKL